MDKVRGLVCTQAQTRDQDDERHGFPRGSADAKRWEQKHDNKQPSWGNIICGVVIFRTGTWLERGKAKGRKEKDDKKRKAQGQDCWMPSLHVISGGLEAKGAVPAKYIHTPRDEVTKNKFLGSLNSRKAAKRTSSAKDMRTTRAYPASRAEF
ncbi:predicted protein [Pyrenophora tritici-repentis Pt-1C-BFP]|uniref:Uncharacterized protein n=1 Tax=Pyrenophora tritici-repentis (strain Pt-1C-BFP) TaxID=426418 RepID=B2W757_PYRTR|nr:uncharacterized protein PTRG_05645 [Pyrenophora tritici-repentis Pt-1C-BFP]EDU48565.1 predicted protein [Pyrenophora tritici-repentis Pt-1C-BFP]